jgi:RNA polymerase sigma-70 factor (ECF subfamily)
MRLSHAPDAAAAPLSDAAVIEASWREPECFGEIFHRYFQEIRRYIARRLGTDVADDVAADTFLAAFRGRKRFDPARGAVRPWLYGIATNFVGQHLRGEQRFYRMIAKTPAEAPTVGPEDRVTAQVSAGSVRRELAESVAALSSGDRDVLLLVALADFTYEEVAMALDLKYGTVASRLNRARKQLRTALGGVDPTHVTEEPPK